MSIVASCKGSRRLFKHKQHFQNPCSRSSHKERLCKNSVRDNRHLLPDRIRRLALSYASSDCLCALDSEQNIRIFCWTSREDHTKKLSLQALVHSATGTGVTSARPASRRVAQTNCPLGWRYGMYPKTHMTAGRHHWYSPMA